ncbi:4Fe-4S dicluster domain-containing protein [Egicoccus halophilus]|uniref:Dimethyl sulfoxide reductase subunit B n=1 Tax=Egicoccus halophilus TaxID=1670830 RepID=A0A8J3A5G9_9ACTN|nr:4Fe-4S dicluster domain-containing protein [Egicoccus halophilus]GGI03580.1 dimethyl sulfoxide reductase subunit B [Egicoccus halophilus]
MTDRLGFYVNLDKCVGCRTCEAACDQTWETPIDVSFRKVGTLEAGDFPDVTQLFMSLSCNHCDMPACASACPTGAYTKRDDGIVLVDQDVCIGCKMCTFACPYGAPQYDKKLGKVSKCNMCAPIVDEGGIPACVESCPYDALDWGPMDELYRRHPTAQREAPFFPDIDITRPNILFDLPAELPDDLRRVDGTDRLAESREG